MYIYIPYEYMKNLYLIFIESSETYVIEILSTIIHYM